jgi:hypothetical protein
MQTRTRRRAAARGAIATLVTTLVALAAPGLAPVAAADTTFEASDGNMVADGTGPDWASFANKINCVQPLADCALDLATGTGDDAFGQGSKDDKSTLDVVDGSVPNAKDDLARLYAAGENRSGHTWVYLGWVRNATSGTANFSIELNKVATTAVPTVGKPYTIARTAGDLLVLYDFAKGSKVDTFQLRLSKWVTSGAPRTVCQANSTVPCWGKAVDITKAAYAKGSINKSPTTDKLYPEPSGGPANGLPTLTFGEVAIDLTAAGINTQGCAGFGSAMIRSRASAAFDAELKDFIAPARIAVGGNGTTDTTGWSSDGSAFTDSVYDSQLLPDGARLGTSASSSGTSSESHSVLAVDVPTEKTGDLEKGSVLHADVLTASAASTLTADTTSQTSVARVAGVNILDGLVTASVIESDGLTTANASGATPSTAFSGLKDLRVDLDGKGGNPPVAMNNVAPNTRIDLSPTIFGEGSFIELRGQQLSTSYPAPGTPLGSKVTYDARVNPVTMIHVHVTDRTPDEFLLGGLPNPFADGNVTTDVVLASATAHSHSAGILCQAAQAVEGHATVLRGNVGNLVGASLGNAALPAGGGGGADHQGIDTLNVGPNVVTAGVSTSDTSGGWGATSSDATSQANVAGLCIQLIAGGACEIGAQVLESHVSSQGTATSWSSTGGSSFVNLTIMGTSVPVGTSLVQDIPGIGKVAINELVCGDGNPPPSGSSTCSTSGPSSAMTVRALHVVITELLPANPLGLKLGSEIVVAESYSGATFVAV